MSRAFRWIAPIVVAGFVLSCGGGGGGEGDGGEGDGDVEGFAFNQANIEFAAGLGARVVDAFPPISDLLTPAFSALGEGSMRSGEVRALPACAHGEASLRWTDGSGDGSWSAGDTARIDVGGCRVHGGDGVVLGGSLTLTFSSVVRGHPGSVRGQLELALDMDDGQPGTLRGPVALTATSLDVEHYGLVYQSSGSSLVTATGSTPFEFGCFDVRDDPHPALEFARRVAITGVIRTGDRIISIDPGANLLYRPNDVPGGGGLRLLSIATPLCTDIGVDPGGVRSDLSMMTVIPAGEGGDVRLELYHRGSTQPDFTETCHWSDLLHTSVGGTINGTNVLDIASVVAFAPDLPRLVGGTGLDLVIGVASGHPVPLCTAGGYTVNITPGPLAMGHVATITFGGCVTGELGTLGGSMTVTVTGVAGDPSTTTYTIATKVSAIDISVTDDIGASRITGAFRFERTASAAGVAERSESEPGASLAVTEGTGAGATEMRLNAFSLHAEQTGAGFTMASGGDSMELVATGISGELAVSVTGTVSGVEPDPPHTGDLKVSASDGTSVVLHMESGGAIRLDLDADGDGTVDATIPTSWESLD